MDPDDWMMLGLILLVFVPLMLAWTAFVAPVLCDDNPATVGMVIRCLP